MFVSDKEIVNISVCDLDLCNVYVGSKEIWRSSIEIIKAGVLLEPDLIIGNTYSKESQHVTSTGVIESSGNYFGGSCSGVYGAPHNCSNNAYFKGVITLDEKLIGKTCIMDAYYSYSDRNKQSSSYIKNGSNTIFTFSSGTATKNESKTFVLESNVIEMYVSFACWNDSWGPSGHIGIVNMTIE